mmetsp:Transcript_12980/g.37374  ORF Transcript_12980/g.37374 Transcript_12980/m.37374 type:complete len:193 (+) Transcript_12980:75-653(+)
MSSWWFAGLFFAVACSAESGSQLRGSTNVTSAANDGDGVHEKVLDFLIKCACAASDACECSRDPAMAFKTQEDQQEELALLKRVEELSAWWTERRSKVDGGVVCRCVVDGDCACDGGAGEGSNETKAAEEQGSLPAEMSLWWGRHGGGHGNGHRHGHGGGCAAHCSGCTCSGGACSCSSAAGAACCSFRGGR